MQRRSMIAGAVAVASAAVSTAMSTAWRSAHARSAALGGRVATPPQAEGPFYPVRWPPETDPDLMTLAGRPYARGEPLALTGRVERMDGRPLAGVAVEIWQCDADGHYHHPGDGGRADPAFQGYGRAVTDADGRYRFRTMRPVPYPGRTPHIHVKVGQGGRTLLTTQMYVAGEPANERDGLLASVRDTDRRNALLSTLVRDPAGGWAGQFPIVLDLRG